MGWNVHLFMKFSDGRDPLRSYVCLLEKLVESADLFQVTKLSAFMGSKVSQRKWLEVGTDRATLGKELALVSEQADSVDRSKLILEAKIEVPRDLRVPCSDEDDQFQIECGPISTGLYLRGEHASWNPVRNNRDLNLIWSVGDFKNYDRNVYQAPWEANCKKLISEVKVLIGTSCIAEIWGGQESFDGDLRNAFLVYTKQDSHLSQSAVQKAKAFSGGLSVEILDGGALIYSKDYINGDLRGLVKS